MRKTIWKYPVLPGEFVLEIPGNAQILTVQVQAGSPNLWALVDPEATKVRRRFFVAGTGHEVPEGFTYVQTFQLQDGALVFHLFVRHGGT